MGRFEAKKVPESDQVIGSCSDLVGCDRENYICSKVTMENDLDGGL